MLHFSYISGNSFLHRTDPVSKFAWLMAIACLGYVITNPLHQLVLTFVIIACAFVLARLPAKYFFAGFQLFLSFALLIFALQLLFAPAQGTLVYFHWGIFTISQSSIQFALNLGIRVINVGSSVSILDDHRACPPSYQSDDNSAGALSFRLRLLRFPALHPGLRK